jgi:hypothetical protein
MITTFKKEPMAKFLVLLVLVYILLWTDANFFHVLSQSRDWYNMVYGTMALFGGIFGLIVAYRWGGLRSQVGRTITFFSLGLLLQEFGQVSYNYYRYILHVTETPYPSMGDIGFLGYIPMYMLGMYYLGKISGAQLGVGKWVNQLHAFFVFAIVVGGSYYFFLHGYTYDFTKPVVMLFDLGYPLGQASNMAAMIVALIFSWKYLGGVMRSRVLFLAGAFTFQYIADFNFLYQLNRGTWSYSGYGDLLYLVAYFLMAFGLVQLKTVFDTVRKTT